MTEEELNKMCSDIYEGEDWQPMKNYIINLQNQLQQKENIIKEVREYIEKRKDTQKWRKESLKEKSTNIDIVLEHYRDILEILDKGDNNGERQCNN